MHTDAHREKQKKILFDEKKSSFCVKFTKYLYYKRTQNDYF